MRRLALLVLGTLAALAACVFTLVPTAQAVTPPDPSPTAPTSAAGAPATLAAVSSPAATASAQNGRSAATAASGGYYYVIIDGAEARFYPTGEVLQTYDTKADGHHVVTYYATTTGAHGALADYKGRGSHTTKNLSIPESGAIAVNVCVAEGSRLLYCSGPQGPFSARG